jgi:hypothetical protein
VKGTEDHVLSEIVPLRWLRVNITARNFVGIRDEGTVPTNVATGDSSAARRVR